MGTPYEIRYKVHAPAAVFRARNLPADLSVAAAFDATSMLPTNVQPVLVVIDASSAATVLMLISENSNALSADQFGNCVSKLAARDKKIDELEAQIAK